MRGSLASIVADEAHRLHIIGPVAYARSEHEPVTNVHRVSVNGQWVIDVPDTVRSLGIEAARHHIQDLLLAQAYPNGL